MSVCIYTYTQKGEEGREGQMKGEKEWKRKNGLILMQKEVYKYTTKNIVSTDVVL